MSDYDARLSDIKKALASILQLDIHTQMKKRIVGYVIWEVATYLHGNFKGRYRSKGAMTPGAVIQRDHVNQKARIIERMLANPDQVDARLSDLVHCVVTKEEHERLTAYSKSNPEIDGWDRYRMAGVEVMDMLTMEQII
ncbi:MAG: hypothetical protein ACJ74T_19500 [Pyrinomonadaceae bacterium]